MSLNINTQISWPIFIVDDHPIYGEALQACLQKSYPDHMVGYYSDSQQALDEIPASFQQGILIIDINMPDLNGIEFSKKLRKGGADFRIIFCTAERPEQLSLSNQLLQQHSFVFKDEPLPTLHECIDKVILGRKYHSPQCKLIECDREISLTNKQKTVLCLLKAGLSYQQVADEMKVSLNTAKSHVKSIYTKLEANNRTEALLKAEQMRLI